MDSETVPAPSYFLRITDTDHEVNSRKQFSVTTHRMD